MTTRPIHPHAGHAGRPPARFSDFAVEAKYNGQRGVALVDGDTVTLLSRNCADITRTSPENTAALPAALRRRSAILDGEIVALDDEGVPCSTPPATTVAAKPKTHQRVAAPSSLAILCVRCSPM